MKKYKNQAVEEKAKKNISQALHFMQYYKLYQKEHTKRQGVMFTLSSSITQIQNLHEQQEVRSVLFRLKKKEQFLNLFLDSTSVCISNEYDERMSKNDEC